MGWAKYYEDNLSICIGRMAVKKSIIAMHAPVNNYRIIEHRQTPIQVVASKNVVKRVISGDPNIVNGRRGLELFFITEPEAKLCRNLQMNGWWWSAAKKSWCNFNNTVNRKYAEEAARKYRAQITIIAA